MRLRATKTGACRFQKGTAFLEAAFLEENTLPMRSIQLVCLTGFEECQNCSFLTEICSPTDLDGGSLASNYSGSGGGPKSQFVSMFPNDSLVDSLTNIIIG